MKQGIRSGLAALLILYSLPGRTDIEDSAYDTGSQHLSRAARQAGEAKLARERLQEAERERREREDEARHEAERQARLASRPFNLRLTESRCTVCHAATHFQKQEHALPGWLWVVLRMKYINEAQIDINEIPVIVMYLASSHPAADAQAALEYAAASFALVGMLLPALWYRRRQWSHG